MDTSSTSKRALAKGAIRPWEVGSMQMNVKKFKGFVDEGQKMESIG